MMQVKADYKYLQVAASEAGGITQGIGAYKVLVPFDGKLQPCVFLDTPGHEVQSLANKHLKLSTDVSSHVLIVL